jgi:hypothetical protein
MCFSQAKVDSFWINGAKLCINEALELVLRSVNALWPRSLVASGLTSKNHQMMLFTRKAFKSHFANSHICVNENSTSLYSETWLYLEGGLYGFSIRLKRQKLRENYAVLRLYFLISAFNNIVHYMPRPLELSFCLKFTDWRLYVFSSSCLLQSPPLAIRMTRPP